MPRYSPIRKDKIKEARDFLENNGLLDGTANQQFYMLFRDGTKIKRKLTFKELCLIRRPDQTEIDKRTGEGERPDYYNVMQTRQEIKNFRKMNNCKGVILYCVKDGETNILEFYNITTMELIIIVENKNKKIIKGLKHNMEDAKKFIKLPKEMKKQITRSQANLIRSQVIQRLEQAAERKRKREMQEQIYA